MSRRNAEVERAAREERLDAIRRCHRCDPCGWRLGLDLTPIEPAIRCNHDVEATPPALRDITEPIHQSDDIEE